VRACRSLLVTALVLLLLAAATATTGLPGILLQVHNEPCPRLLLVPLEASEVGLVELVIGLGAC
jgi:hypothetical protein